VSLSLLNALPDPHSQMESMRRALFAANEERDALRLELQEARTQIGSMAGATQQLRSILDPLYGALRRVYGELDEVGGAEGVGAPAPKADTRLDAVWGSWKTKLGGKAALAIDALLLHGEMTARQLRIHISCGNEYVYKVITQLTNAGILVKRDGKFSLCQL
jgi:hypothetical protein